MRQPCLGRGSFGEVHRMEDKQTGFQCAVKKVCQKKKKNKVRQSSKGRRGKPGGLLRSLCFPSGIVAGPLWV